MMPRTADQADSVSRFLRAQHVAICATVSAVGRAIDCCGHEQAEVGGRVLDELFRKHIRLEEHILFPLLEARCGMIEWTAVMRAEHREIETLLEELIAALDARAVLAARSTLFGIGRILGAHMFKEERFIYPRTDDALGSIERCALLAKMRKSMSSG